MNKAETKNIHVERMVETIKTSNTGLMFVKNLLSLRELWDKNLINKEEITFLIICNVCYYNEWKKKNN